MVGKYVDFFACGLANQCHDKDSVGAMNGLTALGVLAPASLASGWVENQRVGGSHVYAP